jgi:hypothetical protein
VLYNVSFNKQRCLIEMTKRNVRKMVVGGKEVVHEDHNNASLASSAKVGVFFLCHFSFMNLPKRSTNKVTKAKLSFIALSLKALAGSRHQTR